MRTKFLVVMAVILFFATAANGIEGYYMARDGQGRWYFSNAPTWRQDMEWVLVFTAPRLVSSGIDDAAQAIARRCAREWPDDFRMQQYCRERQVAGLLELIRPRPDDVSESEFSIVRRKCIGEWADDFRMVAYCEQRQFEALRKLR